MAKLTAAECYLSEIIFSEDGKDIIRCIKYNNKTHFVLMDYLYDHKLLNNPED